MADRLGTLSDKILPEDGKYFVQKPDKNFSPQRNHAVILESIRKTEKFFKELNEINRDALGERLDVLNSYGRYRLNKGEKGFDDWAGKELMRELLGEAVLEKVKMLTSIQNMNRQNGNDKFLNFI